MRPITQFSPARCQVTVTLTPKENVNECQLRISILTSGARKPGGCIWSTLDRPVTFGLSMIGLCKILKNADNEDVLTLQYEDESSELILLFENSTL